MINVKTARIISGLSLLIAILALYVSVLGILNDDIYGELLATGSMSKTLVQGSIAQDIISIFLAFVLLLLAVSFLKSSNYKIFIVILGLISYFFYAYGIYVIQGQYTSLYLVYMVIFSLSLYSFVFGLKTFNTDICYQLPRKLDIAIILFLALIIVILAPAWLSQVIASIKNNIPSEVYGVLILDLCIVFPAFLIVVVKVIMNKSFANILAGLALLKVLTVCLSWGFAEWFVEPINYFMTSISTILTVVSLILVIIYMIKLRVIK